ncbi:MAG TPA: hypothetical protein VKB62_03700 [Streptosporangiaceae bacterium]|nr:hypothetical protein [Streptosporangiaceae bacterium]
MQLSHVAVGSHVSRRCEAFRRGGAPGAVFRLCESPHSRQRTDYLAQFGNLLRHDRAGGLQRPAGELTLRSHNLVGDMPLPRDSLVGEVPLPLDGPVGKVPLPRDSLVGEVPLAGNSPVGKVPLAGKKLVSKVLRTRPQLGRVGECVQRRDVRPGRLSSLVAGADRADYRLAASAHLVLALAHLVLTLAELLLAAVHDGEQLILDFLRQRAGINH